MILALAVALLAVPASADVKIIATAVDTDKVEISYDASGEGQLVRAFALDIEATDGTIIDVIDYAVGDNTGGYGIFPANFSRYITVNPETGLVDNWDVEGYTPVADGNDPGALGGLGTSGITIEMGSLYEDNPPGDTGVLCTVVVSEGTSQVCVTGGNAIRGNVVMEDTSEATLDLSEACAAMVGPECFPSTNPAYATWVALGKPDCWCDPPEGSGYQCRGDGDQKTSGFPFNYRIYTGDLAALINNWKKKASDPTLDPCADYDRKSSGFPFNYQVYTGDLSILIANWKAKDADLPSSCE